MPPTTRAHDYGPIRYQIEQLLLRVFANRWLARLHLRTGLHPPIRIWSETIQLAHPAPLPPPLHIVFASDFHAGCMTHPQVITDACTAIKRLRPDLLLLGGDYVSWHHRFIAELAPLLAALPAPIGRYAVVGNHDLWADDRPISVHLQRHDVTVLINREIRLPQPYQQLCLYGMDDPTAGTPLPPPLLPADATHRLVLMHSPEGLAHLASTHDQLAFAGHTHGGQVVLPNGHAIGLRQGSLSQRYAYGRHMMAPSGGTLFVSRGVGYGDLPVRWHAPADVLSLIITWHTPP